MPNNLPKQLDCPFCENGIADLMQKQTTLYVEGVSKTATKYYYECSTCKETFTTTESDELTVADLEAFPGQEENVERLRDTLKEGPEINKRFSRRLRLY